MSRKTREAKMRFCFERRLALFDTLLLSLSRSMDDLCAAVFVNHHVLWVAQRIV